MIKTKKVLHLAKTSLAGAPYRIVNALNEYTEFEARLATYMPISLADGSQMFSEDISWQNAEQRQEIAELAKNADIIHMHHYMNTDLSNPFMIDLQKIVKPNCKFLRHFHSDRDYISKSEIRFEENYANDILPKVVIPHYPERTFLNLEIVPNIIPINEELYKPMETNNERPVVAFSASNKTSFKKMRWATKGYPEVNSLLNQLSKKYNFEYIEINGIAFEDAMKIKRKADIVIGDIVTGSYHLTELEALSLGKPCLTYLDARSVMTFMNTFKTSEIPFVNVNINNLEIALSDLLKSTELRKEIGQFSRWWIEKFYNDSILIKKFVDIYNDILSGKNILRANCNEYPQAKEFLYNRIYDYNWLNICEK